MFGPARRLAAALLLTLAATGCAAPAAGRTITATRPADPAGRVFDATVGDGCRAYHQALDNSGQHVGRVLYPVLYVLTFPLHLLGGANLAGFHWP